MIPGTASFPVQDHNRLYRRKTREKSVSVLPKEKNWFESECWTGRETGKEWPWRNKRDSDRCCSYRDNVCLIPLIIWLMTKTSAKTTIYLFKGGTSRDKWKFRHWLDYECRCNICVCVVATPSIPPSNVIFLMKIAKHCMISHWNGVVIITRYICKWLLRTSSFRSSNI